MDRTLILFSKAPFLTRSASRGSSQLSRTPRLVEVSCRHAEFWTDSDVGDGKQAG